MYYLYNLMTLGNGNAMVIIQWMIVADYSIINMRL